MKKYNINSYMYIQITDNGWKHLKNTVGDEYVKNCIENRMVIIENKIWYKLQCHNVFELFPISIGNEVRFNTNVMFDDEDLK